MSHGSQHHPSSQGAAQETSRYMQIISMHSITRSFVTTALSCGLVAGAAVGCDPGQSPASSLTSSNSKRWTSVGFGESVAQLANVRCKCETGEKARASCVVQAASEIIEGQLGDIDVEGPIPSVDEKQIVSLRNYITVDETPPGACDFRGWMGQVSRTALNTPSAGDVQDAHTLYRIDGRHPNSWREFGFMAASTKGSLTSLADPYQHFKNGSDGSQVWVSVSESEEGIDYYINDAGLGRTRDVCIKWDAKERNFFADEKDESCEDEPDGLDGRPVEYFSYRLYVTYQYRRTLFDDAVPVFRPSQPEVPAEEEALVLGFRPTEYRGWVADDIYGAIGTTSWKDVAYASDQDCVQQERPAFRAISPFEGLPNP